MKKSLSMNEVYTNLIGSIVRIEAEQYVQTTYIAKIHAKLNGLDEQKIFTEIDEKIDKRREELMAILLDDNENNAIENEG
jgi:hypothetical protein